MGFDKLYEYYPYVQGAIATAGAAQGAWNYFSYKDPSGDSNNMNQDTGQRRRVTRKVTGGRKNFNPMKLLKSTFNYTEQCLGLRAVGTPFGLGVKHPVSEFNPGSGGFIPILQYRTTAAAAGDQNLPMHVYELNTYIGATEDTRGNYPGLATNNNSDANARSWIWTGEAGTGANAGFRNMTDTLSELRWYINEPRTIYQDSNPSAKVYRKGISINYMLYGCQQMATEFDVRVIKIHDMRMCPDFTEPLTLNGDTSFQDFNQNWQNMIRAWVINPMLRGIEPGPKAKKWFTTVAKKRVMVGEQTSNIESVPSVQGSIYVKINEAQNYSWNSKGFSYENPVSDTVPTIEDNGENNNFAHKPWYTSRYYLVIRALCPHNSASTANGGEQGATGLIPGQFNNDGLTSVQTTRIPSYDLSVRTTWMTVNGN